MKFKELPEGWYQILRVKPEVVYIEKIDEKTAIFGYQIDPYAKQVIHDGRTYRHFSRELDNLEIEFRDGKEVRKQEEKERRSRGAAWSHVTRRLNKEPLTGKTLDLALSLVTSDDSNAEVDSNSMSHSIAKKLRAGENLSDYEYHIFVDVMMLHERLG